MGGERSKLPAGHPVISYIRAFCVACEQLRRDGAGAPPPGSRGINKDRGAPRFPPALKAGYNELDRLVVIQGDKPTDGWVEAASTERVRPRVTTGGD